jgi:hypothetical protein
VKLISGIFLGLFILCSFSVFHSDFLEWSENRKLSFDDFKGIVPKNAKTSKSANITTVISYEARQEKGKIPKMTIFNFVDRSTSWTTIKKKEVLEIQQIKFDYSELYARKIRKKMAEMNKKGITDQQKYLNEITKLASLSEKRQKKYSLLLDDQPHLIKIAQKDIQDSLALYRDFAKQ